MFLSESDSARIVEILKRSFDIVLIYAYGSFARGEGREDSDVDIAVYTEHEIDSYALFMISGEIALALGREIQIVDLRTVSTVLGAQIVGNHGVLYCSDDVLRANLNIRFFKEYALLNEERACILDRIREEGQVYG